eukprot:332472-Alexandrium_andersonii.AAC.1
MSASLVGSEMCIRDRAMLEEHGHMASCLKRNRVRERRPAAGTRHSEECRAVSYTHLTLPTICSV